MDVYRQGLSSVVLHGPTIFAQILRAVIAEIRKAPCSQLDQNYYILLIITVSRIKLKDQTLYKSNDCLNVGVCVYVCRMA